MCLPGFSEAYKSIKSHCMISFRSFSVTRHWFDQNRFTQRNRYQYGAGKLWQEIAHQQLHVRLYGSRINQPSSKGASLDTPQLRDALRITAGWFFSIYPIYSSKSWPLGECVHRVWYLVRGVIVSSFCLVSPFHVFYSEIIPGKGFITEHPIA